MCVCVCVCVSVPCVICITIVKQVTITSPTIATKVTSVAPWCAGLGGSLPHRLGRLHPPAAWGTAWAACTDGWMDGRDGWINEIDEIDVYMSAFCTVSFASSVFNKRFKGRATYPINELPYPLAK